uniref:Uncharacterized protein n=1 Tax=uncultured Armatimonadetes bacterium TaxID=157466 RepID=A0A6J4JN45_9BACT|nr:hypothetical protein AVDCRST_MAG63-4058 [uncultured Armatimonadetes bacterium]
MDIFGAVARRDVAAVRGLLAADRKLAGARDPSDRRPLHLAAERGDLEIARLLLENGARPDAKDKQKRTPLHSAVEGGHRDVARALVRAGAGVSALQQPKYGPLHGWLETGNEAAVDLAVELGADVNHVLQRYGRRIAPLHALAESGHATLSMDCRVRTGRMLLERGADPDARDDRDKTPLHLAAEQGHGPLMEVLLDHGADIEAREKEGGTPLFFAVASADLFAVELLLRRGADPHVRAGDGKTPLDYARDYFGFRYIAETLAEAAGQPVPVRMGRSRPGEFLCACKKGYLDLARRILSDDPNVVHARGAAGLIEAATALHLAATFGQPQIARLLLDHGHPVDAVDQWGTTPLMDAAKMGHIDVARALLDRGAQVNARDAHGSTALHEAAYPRAGADDLVGLLLGAGADPAVRDDNDKRALDRARGHLGHPMFAEHQGTLERVAALLEQA